MKMSMIKGSSSFVALAVTAALWIIHKLRVFALRSAPVGYQDEGGFHFGNPSDKDGKSHA
jgi:hypothetical protein